MYIPWQDSEIFVAVADFGSFSAAARQLRLTQPTVSRRIASLEEHLGRPLFRRDSEGTHITADGARLLPAARQMARWAREMERAAENWDNRPAGTVRCAAPPGVAFEVLVPMATRVREKYPDIRLELLAGVEHIDLTRGQAELAIRTRRPTQPELVTLASYFTDLGVYASESYAATLPEGTIEPSELEWVTWSYPMEHVEPRPTLERLLDPFRIAFATNDYLVLRRAVEEGLGAFVLPSLFDEQLRWEPLVEIDTSLPLPDEAGMHLVCARSARQLPRVRAVAEMIVDEVMGYEGVRVEVHD